MKDSAEGFKVWILIYYSLDKNTNYLDESKRVQVIPFSSLEKLEEHVRNLIKKNIDMFDPKVREAVLHAIETNDITMLMVRFRTNLCNNENSFKFDLFWDNRPEVVL